VTGTGMIVSSIYVSFSFIDASTKRQLCFSVHVQQEYFLFTLCVTEKLNQKAKRLARGTENKLGFVVKETTPL
jgi:hypothetical protein